MATNGRIKIPKGLSFRKIRSNIKRYIHALPPGSAGFAIVVEKEAGGQTDAILQGDMVVIVAGLRALADQNKKFKQCLEWALIPDPGSERTVDLNGLENEPKDNNGD